MKERRKNQWDSREELLVKLLDLPVGLSGNMRYEI